MPEHVMGTAIKGFERVVQAVGFETVFHDGEVLTLSLSRMAERPSLDITILTPRSRWPSEIDYTLPEYYTVRIVFRGIDDLELEGFNHQNVLQCLVEERVGDRLKICLAGLFGVECSFSCDESEVLSVEPSEVRCGQPLRPTKTPSS